MVRRKPADRLTGCALALAGLAYLAVAALWPQRSSADFGTWLVHLAAFVVPIVLALMAAGRFVKRAAR